MTSSLGHHNRKIALTLVHFRGTGEKGVSFLIYVAALRRGGPRQKAISPATSLADNRNPQPPAIQRRGIKRFKVARGEQRRDTSPMPFRLSPASSPTYNITYHSPLVFAATRISSPARESDDRSTPKPGLRLALKQVSPSTSNLGLV